MTMNSRTILVVDDEKEFRSKYKKILKSEGFRVLEAPDALEVANILMREKSSLDVILLDINMPLMDGWDFLAALNQKLPEHELSMAILTSSVSDVDRAKASLYPSVVGYLTKPLTLEKICSIWP